MNECEHYEFEASVAVNRIEDAKAFMADVHIKCVECGRLFKFLALPAGVSLERATVSIDQTEARLPIAPLDDVEMHMFGYAEAK